MDLSIIIPVHNEEKNLPILYERCVLVLEKLKVQAEMIFIDDGSFDKSLDIILELSDKDERIHYFSFTRNFGHQIALSCGLEHASGAVIVTIDSDLQDPPELIIEMYEEWKKGYKLVYAKRRKREGEGFFKKAFSFLFYRILSRMVGFDIPLDTGDYRLMDRQVVDVLLKLKEHQHYLRGQVAWTGLKSTFVYFNRHERKFGDSSYPFKKQLRLALDGITSFSSFPLKLVVWAGFLVFLIAFILIVYTLYVRLIGKHTVEGWASLMISLLFLGGIQMISIGILGQYIRRIDENVRDRPNYVLKEIFKNE